MNAALVGGIRQVRGIDHFIRRSTRQSNRIYEDGFGG